MKGFFLEESETTELEEGSVGQTNGGGGRGEDGAAGEAGEAGMGGMGEEKRDREIDRKKEGKITEGKRSSGLWEKKNPPGSSKVLATFP